ncbi:10802_t:CDS:2 [Funneliformis mosseae]|uniref:10802_t:CDS:1 n=1 Tax=Funneliformis mosseae TaxID=27381 RepID=A0A9N9DI94_FUNMO|nr:10802_t:CDS:2 [Funneliformis mosseae]
MQSPSSLFNDGIGTIDGGTVETTNDDDYERDHTPSLRDFPQYSDEYESEEVETKKMQRFYPYRNQYQIDASCL